MFEKRLLGVFIFTLYGIFHHFLPTSPDFPPHLLNNDTMHAAGGLAPHFAVPKKLRRATDAQHLRMSEFAQEISKPTGDAYIDADWQTLAKVLHNGNICPFHRKILPKIMRYENIRIVIVGGSMTYGANIPKKDTNKWSTVLYFMLNSGWYSGIIEVFNIAVPATSVEVWIDKIRMTEIADTTVGDSADLIIVDLQVNDQVFKLEALPALYHAFIKVLDGLPSRPAVMFTQTFITLGNAFNEISRKCPLEGQWGDCCGGYYWCMSHWNMTDYVVPTLNLFGVPYISYRDLFWPHYENNSLVRLYWNGNSHPDVRTHKMFAKMVSFLFFMQLNESITESQLGERPGKCSSTLLHGNPSSYHPTTARNKSLSQLCPGRPSTFMHASDKYESIHNFKVPTTETTVQSIEFEDEIFNTTVQQKIDLQWRFYDDSRAKFGWILDIDSAELNTGHLCNDGTSDSSTTGSDTSSSSSSSSPLWCDRAREFYRLPLEVEVGNEAIIQLFFLKSYNTSMGVATVWLDSYAEESVQVSGFSDKMFSITSKVTLSNRSLDDEFNGTVSEVHVLPHLTAGKHILHISGSHFLTDRFKWKLLGLTSC